MGRKTTVQIFQVTNVNIDRKTIKTMKQNGKKNNCIDISSVKYKYRQKIIKTRKQKWVEKRLYRYFK